MPSTTNLPLKDAAKRCNVKPSVLEKWCAEGKVPSHENLEQTHRFVSVAVLPMILALAKGEEPCRLCRNTGRTIIAGVKRDCPRCGESRGESSPSPLGSPLSGYVPIFTVNTDGEGRLKGVTVCKCEVSDPDSFVSEHPVTCPLGEPA